jgi:hypothetical protein
VVAANGLRAEFAKASNDLVRIGPVADNIAETNGHLPPARGRIERSGEGRGVCVKITKNENAHSCHPQNAIEYR